MKIGAVADTHLGFRAFNALIGGRNAREVDVERAWDTLIEQLIAAECDVVTIAGDVFHHPRVSDYAKQAFLRGVRRLLAAYIRVIVLQGNHDAGKTADVLTPILLADGMGDMLRIVTTPKRVHFEIDDERAAFACFPYVSRSDGTSYRLEPDPGSDVNVLVMHAAVKGTADGDKLPHFYGNDSAALDVGRQAGLWDAIAVGDYHEFTRLHPTRLAFYSGSIERTSTNIWAETASKGWVLVDTKAETMEFQEIPTRGMFDVDDSASVIGHGQDFVNSAMLVIEGTHDSADAIVRLKVTDFPKEEYDQIDWALVRRLKQRCLHFELDLRFATGAARTSFQRGEARTLSLRDAAVEYMADDGEPVRDLVLHYFDGVEGS